MTCSRITATRRRAGLAMLLFYLVCARAFASAGGDEVHAHDRTHDASAFTVTFEHTHVTSRDDDPSQPHVHSQTGAALWLADGGRGFWRLFDERLAQSATSVLDFYHAAQNLWKEAKSWLHGQTQQPRDWFTTARRRLRRGQVKDVLADLQAALELEGLPDSARDTLTNLYNYLDKHRDHMDYAKFKELGVPIGSGMVESACKWLIHQRFKGVGMRWSEDGFNHLLHLRLAWVNGRFDDLFPLVVPPT